MKLPSSAPPPCHRAVWGHKHILAAAAMILVGLAPNAMAAGRHAHEGRKAADGRPNSSVKPYRLDNELTMRAARNHATRKTKVVVELMPGAKLPQKYLQYAQRHGQLGIINGFAIELPDRLIAELGTNPAVFRLHYDRPAGKFNYRTSLTVGSKAVRDTLGFTGAGVGVAIIDSGIAAWHDDLSNSTNAAFPYGNQRVSKFVDFVNGQTTPYDDNGHGSHVAGIVAGNGYDSNGQKSGTAPEASLVSLKVLDGNGNGTVSNIIAALDWVLANHATYNIRVVNMSVGAAIHESAFTDPLTLAAKRVVDAGVVVVGAAGNFGKNSAGLPQYGGISAPGNAPWVLTVGGSSTNGTPKRTDDTIGDFSSRGPSYIDWNAKPDLVAPGTGTVSLSSPGSTFVLTHPTALLGGLVGPAAPYLSLSGTSMAAPVVAGTVALMIQANPNLTPNAVKAILQYTAQQYPNYDALTQGAGFLNVVGAIRLSRFYATAAAGAAVPVQKMWSKHIIWGNHRLGSGMLNPNANAFRAGTNRAVPKTGAGATIVWGTAGAAAACDTILGGTAADGDNIVWGTPTADGDNIVWGTANADGDNIVWGTATDGDNIVWGTDCGGADCDNVVWGLASADGDNIVWGTAVDGDNIVWGTAVDGDNIVWGTAADGDHIAGGTAADGDNIVWGTAADGDNIVWGTAADGDNIVWGTATDGDNIVWGTDGGGNLVWSTADGDNIVWGTANQVSDVWVSEPNGARAQLSGAALFDKLKDKTLLSLLDYPPRARASDALPVVVPQPPPPPPPPPIVTTATTVTSTTNLLLHLKTTVTRVTTTTTSAVTGQSTVSVTTTTVIKNTVTGATTTTTVTF